MPRHWRIWATVGLLAGGIGLGGRIAAADEPLRIDVTIQDHRFIPAEIDVPSGKPVILTMHNQDAGPEEFDSSALKVEKVIVGGSYGIVRLRPLGPGRYPFMGEFHPQTAQGVVVSR